MDISSEIFTTARLRIRRAMPEDATFLDRLWHDPRVMTNVGFPDGLPINRVQIENKIRGYDPSEYDKTLIVALRSSGQPIGECMLGWPDEQGISLTDVKLSPEFWGQRYGVEVKQGLLDYLFTHAPVLAVEADPAWTNLPSIRMQERVGGLRVREYDSDFNRHLVYRVHRFDWERLRAGLPVASEPLRSLLAGLLPGLVPGCQALALTGSFARDCAGETSDIDLYRFVEPPVAEPHRYSLKLPQRRLVSLTTAVLSEKMAELQKPQRAIWAAPGFRQAWVLFDRSGGLAQLKAQAAAYDPAAHPVEAAAWISETLLNNSEEVTKVFGALQRNDEGAALYGVIGLDYNLNLIAAVHLGVLIESENRFFEQVQQAAPPEWTRLERILMGFEPADIGQRARAGLGLYRYTCRWLDGLIQPQHRDIIAYAVGLIPPEWEEI
ncbi:acetyltransferase [Longilinea arvoryzae]|uniref:Acetyltransferase n=1 Tax=Longilinea arvoryzae TaxID=360412 RepID=A0A0S7BDH3_9CHLR|nr:GNAT family N-acetyltransferase [Longilinea arvoryzae]GAP15879.1 acetyltransferase [Longilinea arvoryzae]